LHLINTARGESGFVYKGGHDTVFLGKESEEQVPRVDFDVAVAASDGLGLGDRCAGHLGEVF
jgi:hypothetical protein